jgi:hypothetical protein
MVYTATNDKTTFAPLGGGLKGYLHFPTDLTTDSRGTLYVVDEAEGIPSFSLRMVLSWGGN